MLGDWAGGDRRIGGVTLIRALVWNCGNQSFRWQGRSTSGINREARVTTTGPKVESALDTRTYEKGIKVSDAEMKTLNIDGDPFHPEWNYTIRPRSAENRSG